MMQAFSFIVLSFHFHDAVLWYRLLIVIKSNLFFSFVPCTIYKKLLLTLRSWRFMLVFLVLCFTSTCLSKASCTHRWGFEGGDWIMCEWQPISPLMGLLFFLCNAPPPCHPALGPADYGLKPLQTELKQTPPSLICRCQVFCPRNVKVTKTDFGIWKAGSFLWHYLAIWLRSL